MKFHEFLRTEVWINKTSRKIFAGLGIFLGVVVAGFALRIVIDRNWITPGERSAARIALGKLDAMQDTGYLPTKEFVVWAKLVGKRVDDARQAARATRDKMIVRDLMNFQSTVVASHAMEESQVRGQQRDSRREPDQRMQGFALSSIGFDSRELHKALN